MKKEIVEIIKNTNYMRVSWKMTNWCNYHCPYCRSSSSSFELIPYETIIQQAKQINQLIDALDRKIILVLVGGEITYYSLENLISNYLNSSNIYQITIITNLSREANYFLNLKNVCNNKNVKLEIVASVHLTQIPNIDEFISKLEMLSCKVNIVLTPTNYIETKQFLEKIVGNTKIGKVDLLFDRHNKIENNNLEIEKVYSYYVDNFVKENESNPANYTVTFENKKAENYTRAEIRFLDYDFTGYNCLGSIRIDTDGSIVTGACHSHKNIKLNIFDFDNLNYEEIKNKLTIKCTQKICTLCLVSHIWKDN